MKVLLVVKSKMMENLGVMYLSSIIKKSGHKCKITDLQNACNYAIKWEPEIIGYSILTGDRNKFKILNDRLKSQLKFKSIVGNCDPTFFPEGYDWADEIVKGEGENWINQFLTKDNYTVYKSIDEIPWPDRTDFPNMKIRDFVSSRGCPFACRYCYNAKWAELFPEQKGVRVRDPKDVIAEIKSVNPEYIFFQDSCFGVNMNWFMEFSKGMKDEIKKPYQCNFRPEQITEERVKLLQQSGCIAVRMALESASNRLRELIGRKGYGVEDIKKASSLLKDSQIMYMIQNILQLPESSIEDDLLTLQLNIECRPTYSWTSIYTPYPGTKLGDYCKTKGFYKGDYSNITDSFFDKSVLEYSETYKEQVYCLQKIFALCVETGIMPDINDLAVEKLPNFIHKAMRKIGDKRLYVGLL
jgi:radical SAM superfamily enzyme YgiQ (UPF0313 family)